LEFLYDYGLFLAQAATVVIAILIVAVGLVALGQKQKPAHTGHIEITKLNDRYRDVADTLRDALLPEDTLKHERKSRKKEEKERAKAEQKQRKQGQQAEPIRKRLYVLDFDGDLKASETEHLREEISAVLPQARDGDQVLVRLESPGGLVHGYGLAASQLQRIRDAGVELVVAVDKVAASGGYMMACVANRIIAAPFAVIGSIGVLAQLPNFHRLLQKHEIDFELLTAGEYKRTLTIFGENTEKGREKFLEELEQTHDLFKEHVSRARPGVDIARVATGEVWYGQQARDVGLVDDLCTSDSLVQERLADWDVYEVKYVLKKSWQEKLGLAAEGAIERSLTRILQRALERKPY
jgi:serine protease SohB